MDSDDERQGAMILIKALSAPCMQVAENAGIEGAVILSKVQAMCREKGVSIYTISQWFKPLFNMSPPFLYKLCFLSIYILYHSFHVPFFVSRSSDMVGTQANLNFAISWSGE
jgi:hypothetical protein